MTRLATLLKNCPKHAKEWKVPCWVLAKREAENYLPRILLEKWKDHRNSEHAELVDAWDQLTDDQKDFYDMKKGSGIEAELFQDLSPTDSRVLSRGFGPESA